MPRRSGRRSEIRRISADEQVEFLRRLHAGDLGVSDRAIRILRELALLREGPARPDDQAWRLYGKTGTSEVTATRENGWIVGWLEQGDRRWYYAINMEGERVWEAWPPARRTDLALAALRKAGVPVLLDGREPEGSAAPR